ncbi:translocon-associated protein subunit delta-like [Rhopilema esculentum]|uniref:translocon-associated protein subunit delta-like n=1 Tax=Rhopilema esculentum TaxID=499914 RepID=UPI0031E00AF7
MFFRFLLVLCLAASINGLCQKAKISADTYSTKSATISSQTVYIAELSISCDSEFQEQNFFAEVNGLLVPVAKSEDSGKYQVSWSTEHKAAQKGDIPIKIYDEEGYSAYRKAQRSGEKVPSVQPLATVTINHTGARREGFIVQTEFLSACVTMLIFWLANTARGKIME